MTTWELSVLFEETYVSLIKAIRTLAYPKYSGTMAEVSQYDYPQHRAVDIPIFVMRPFRGQLEQATHSVVDRLQFEGDKSIFWLDTSGWLNTDINFDERSEDQDFFLDGENNFCCLSEFHYFKSLLTMNRGKSTKRMAPHREGKPTSGDLATYACL